MKLKSLKIKDYRQFKDIEFDFTYPKGHKKEGLPLDKVCFIGQSGTGKTTLLKAIKLFCYPKIFQNFYFKPDKFEIERDFDFNNEKAHIEGESMYNDVTFYSSFYNGIGGSMGGLTFKGGKIEGDINLNPLLDEVRTQLDNQRIFGIFIPEGYKHYSPEKLQIDNYDFVDLRDVPIRSIWAALITSVNGYNAARTLKMNQLYNDTKDSDSKTRDKKFEELKVWEAENHNPLVNIANKVLDAILEPLNLKVHTDLTVDIIKGEFKIPLKNIETDELIPFDLLSSGSQNIIYPSLLFYFFNPLNAMIFFDEVENSLFPDIQRIIIDHYTKLAPNNQFFYATHSPIIASSFEPCERFILYFDEEGYVRAKQGVAPKGDDPNDLLKKDFGMEKLMLDTGIEEYHRYLGLMTKIRNEKDEKKKKELLAEMTALGEAYNF